MRDTLFLIVIMGVATLGLMTPKVSSSTTAQTSTVNAVSSKFVTKSQSDAAKEALIREIANIKTKSECACEWSPTKCKLIFIYYSWAIPLFNDENEDDCDSILFLAKKCVGKAEIEVSEIEEDGKAYYSIHRSSDKRFKGFKCLKK